MKKAMPYTVQFVWHLQSLVTAIFLWVEWVETCSPKDRRAWEEQNSQKQCWGILIKVLQSRYSKQIFTVCLVVVRCLHQREGTQEKAGAGTCRRQRESHWQEGAQLQGDTVWGCVYIREHQYPSRSFIRDDNTAGKVWRLLERTSYRMLWQKQEPTSVWGKRQRFSNHTPLQKYCQHRHSHNSDHYPCQVKLSELECSLSRSTQLRT